MIRNDIILAGFMGCGKSTVGEVLANRLGISLIDTDTYIEQKQGKTISEIFASHGEETFRDMETEALRELLSYPQQTVIALGGGLPIGGNLQGEEQMRQRALLRGEKNRELLKELGRVFYLKVTPQEVFWRLRGDKTRPLLQTEAPLSRITELLGWREEWYEKCADEIIVADGKNPACIADEIIYKVGLLDV